MDIVIEGKQLDVGDALRTYVEDAIVPAVSKYFDRAIDAKIVFSRQGHAFHVDISVHAASNLTVKGQNEASDAHAAFDGALERITKQLRRYKRKLTDHHKNANAANEVMAAQYSIFAAEEGDEELAQEAHPTVVAEMPHEITTMSVSDAVMRLDLGSLPIVMFRNAGHGGLNVVYRRTDGNVGWVDPKTDG